MKFLFGLLFSLILFLSHSAFAIVIVERINEDDIANHQTLNFADQDFGSIQGTDNVFTDFGLANVHAEASANSGEEYARGDYGHALWVAGNGGLQIVENNGAAGCSAYDADFKCVGDRLLPLVDFYEFTFQSELNSIGFYMVDVWLPLVFTFYSNGDLVEVYDEEDRGSWDGNNLGTGTGWTSWRAFESEVAFDQVKIESKDSTADGFGVALIRKEAAQISEPSVLALFAFCAFLLVSRRKNA